MFNDAMDKRLDHDYIRKSMMYVQENHTYVNRIKSIMSVL